MAHHFHLQPHLPFDAMGGASIGCFRNFRIRINTFVGESILELLALVQQLPMEGSLTVTAECADRRFLG
jgi:hypothetical protein